MKSITRRSKNKGGGYTGEVLRTKDGKTGASGAK